MKKTDKELEEEKDEEEKEEEKEEKKEEEKAETDKELNSLVNKFWKIMNAKAESVESKIADVKKGGLYTKESVNVMDSKTRTGEFIKALLLNDRTKIQPLSEGTAANGGFLVPEEWSNTIVENIMDETVVRPRATVVQVSADTWHLPSLSVRPQVYWRSELEVKNTSTAVFAELTLTPYSLAAIITLSQELANDASVGLPGGIVNFITLLISRQIAVEEDRAFLQGNGTGRPTGIDNYTGTIRSLSAGGALSGDHLITCYFNLPQGYRSKAVWLMNSRTIAVVRGLKDSNNQYLLQPLANGQPPQVLGRPVIEANFLPSARIYFGDLSFYYIAQNGGIAAKVSDEATVASQSAFERNLVHVRVEERVDGELALPKLSQKLQLLA